MKIPNKLKIAGQYFDIKLSKGLNSSEDLGITNTTRNFIAINGSSEICKTQQESTLIHEIFEAINIMYELGLNHYQISILETSFYQVLSDNNMLK